jgi:Tfp pilus assembly protein PilE
MTPILRRRLRDDRGVMLADVLMVVFIIGILIACATASYLWVRDGAEEAAAAVNVRTASPAVEFWRNENRGTAVDIDGDETTSGYEGLSHAALLARFNIAAIDVPVATMTEFCIASTVGGQTFFKYGPDGPITEVTVVTPLCS